MKQRIPHGSRRPTRGAQKRILVLGSDGPARRLAAAIARREGDAVRIIGHVRLEDGSDELPPATAVFELEGLAATLRRLRVDETVAARLGCPPAIEACAEAGVPLTVLSELPDEELASPADGAQPAVAGSATPRRLALALKRGLDVGVASTGLVIAAPLLALAALAVQVSSRGPVVSRQLRCGLHGRRFALLRLRTGGRGSVGRLVHASGIDDLLLLWNVLRGDMSLVGPRPPLPAELGRSGGDAARRLSMRPGLTCLWQLRDLPAPCPDECAKLDLQYVDGWSLRTDLKILALTLPAVLRSSDT